MHTCQNVKDNTHQIQGASKRAVVVRTSSRGWGLENACVEN